MVEKEKMTVLVTGANGQLGQCIKAVATNYSALELKFTNAKELDITNKADVDLFFQHSSFDYVINCAAYTNVEQAEKEPDKAFLVNAEGAKNLARNCKEYDTTLFHISTDYVFDGQKKEPYTEEDLPNPINEYGKSKLAGEKHIQELLEKFFIIRTSWLYSEFGHNFFKTIRNKANTESELTIITAETGTPTNANDLAACIIHIITSRSNLYGMYHFSNLGEATWYNFAKEIVRNMGKEEEITLKKTDNYPTFARRPRYSVLNKDKLIKLFNFNVLDWKEALKKLAKK